jgi:hypothetical protein
MTDRHAAYIVVLSDDLREDDAEYTINALRMVKGVARVEPVVADQAIHIAEVRADQVWRDRIAGLLREPPSYLRLHGAGRERLEEL